MGEGWEVRNAGNKDKTRSPVAAWRSLGEHFHGKDVGGQEPGTASPSHSEPLSLILLNSATWARGQERGQGTASRSAPADQQGRRQGLVSGVIGGDMFFSRIPGLDSSQRVPQHPWPSQGCAFVVVHATEKFRAREKTICD